MWWGGPLEISGFPSNEDMLNSIFSKEGVLKRTTPLLYIPVGDNPWLSPDSFYHVDLGIKCFLLNFYQGAELVNYPGSDSAEKGLTFFFFYYFLLLKRMKVAHFISNFIIFYMSYLNLFHLV